VTENLKSGDLSKLPYRTMTMESVFDKLAGHRPAITAESFENEDIEPLVIA
jgi:hypothetical protein